MNYMYIWNNVLHRYSPGMMAAVADSVEKAREMLMFEWYKTEVIPNLYGVKDIDEDEDSWPWCEWLKVQKALQQEPNEIRSLPCCIWRNGSD